MQSNTCYGWWIVEYLDWGMKKENIYWKDEEEEKTHFEPYKTAFDKNRQSIAIEIERENIVQD